MGLKLCIGTLVLLLGTAIDANADLTPYSFTGETTSVDPDLGTTFSVGEALRGTFIFDDAARILGGAPGRLTIFGSTDASLAGTVGAYGFSSSTVGYTIAKETIPGELSDGYSVSAPENAGINVLSGAPVAGWQPLGFLIRLDDPSGTALPAWNLLVPPVFEDYSSASWWLLFWDGVDSNNTRIISGTVTSLYVSVPTLLTSLVDDVIAINLQRGNANAFDTKIDAAMAAIDDANRQNDVAAINALYALINSVEAQRGKALNDADADQLVDAARVIIVELGG